MTEFLKKKSIVQENIITFKVNDPVTKEVANFYKDSPFPNYKDNDNKASILKKGDKNFLAAQFKKFIGYNKNILEVGCGTGQLSIYLSIGTNNNIVGLDPTIESLNLASKFLQKNKIDNVKFVNADIFDDVLTENYFDHIWCSGVLHHTKSPYEAFKVITKSLKKDGYILIGLYNKIGRFRTIVRKYFYKIFGEKFLMLTDPTLKNQKNDKEEQRSWIRDQYIHPVESLHTIDEVLKWFKYNDIDFISSIPSCDFDEDYTNLFSKKSEGTFYSRIINQISMIFSRIGSDGGLFVLIGKKNH
jgi:ubiquinone/menaquinone biosynthesis C-methylase UbiE|tara:strand:+ start:61 stop:963 length:903 start_codon:yes stop_codon:yes gene_type:complete